MNDSLRSLDLRSDPEMELTEVADHLKGGGLVAYPTETVYGLGGACTEAGARKVSALKGRSAGLPLIALVSSADSVSQLAWNEAARELAEIFWPGAVTLVLGDEEAMFPPGVRSESTGAVAVRVSPHPIPARLIAALGGPLTSTSLNAPGEPPANTGHDARRILESMEARDVWLLDAGTLPSSGPSTVVDCTGEEPIVLREGSVPINRLRCAIPEIHGRSADQR